MSSLLGEVDIWVRDLAKREAAKLFKYSTKATVQELAIWCAGV